MAEFTLHVPDAVVVGQYRALVKALYDGIFGKAARDSFENSQQDAFIKAQQAAHLSITQLFGAELVKALPPVDPELQTEAATTHFTEVTGHRAFTAWQVTDKAKGPTPLFTRYAATFEDALRAESMFNDHFRRRGCINPPRYCGQPLFESKEAAQKAWNCRPKDYIEMTPEMMQRVKANEARR